MKRRDVCALLAGLVTAEPFAALGQQGERMRRIGLLRAAPPPDYELEAFLRALAERGYLQGRNYILIPQLGDGTLNKLPELAIALVNLGVDIIVTEGTRATVAAAAVTSIIPIVTASAADPQMDGLIKNISRPGRNITGFASLEKDTSGKFFEILQQLVPGLRRIAVLAPRGPVWEMFTPGQDQAAKALGIEYGFIDMPSPDAVGAAMDQTVAQGAQAAIVRGSPNYSSAQRQLIVDSAAVHRLPVLYERREDAQRGGLASYAADVKGQYGATAEYVVRILAGANPAELPIQQPTKFDLVINMKTARGLGLTIPPSILARADELIE